MKRLTIFLSVVFIGLIFVPGVLAGDTVIIREGFEVGVGQTFLIDDITVRCSLAIPALHANRRSPLAAYSTPILRIIYPNDSCPEVLTGEFNQCPVQDHSLGLASNYSVQSQLPDGRKVVSVYAGRRTGIIAFEGAILHGLCPGIQADKRYEGISVGLGHYLDLE